MLSQLERYIFYVFVFCIPFEKRLILANWLPVYAGQTAVFNEWTSAFIYVSDVLLLSLLVLWLWCWVRDYRRRSYHSITIFLLIFVVIAGLSIFKATIVAVAVFRFLKLLEYIGLYFYIKYNFKKFELKKTLAVFIGSAFLQALTGIAQSYKQAAVGLRMLGESPIKIDSQGVAVFIVHGIKYLRAYGTTPHPNVLAFVLLGGLFSCFIYGVFYEQYSTKKSILIFSAFGLILWTFMLTFSRTMIGVGSVCLLLGFWIFRQKQIARYFIGLYLAISLTFCFVYWPQVISRLSVSYEEEAVQDRLIYNKIALSETRTHFLLGDGIGQSVPAMMKHFRDYPIYVYQPTHNVYLLIVSELGILGFLSIAGFVVFLHYDFSKYAPNKSFRYLVWIISFGLLCMGLLDHFMWTLQQSSLLLWAYCGIIAVYSFTHEDMVK